MGRKPIGKTAMTDVERQQRRRERLRQGQALIALHRAWDACSKAERSRFRRELSADRLATKKARRAERERQLGETIRLENERRMALPGASSPVTLPNGSQIVGWLGGLPLIHTPRV
jgi:hypothetical protein